MREKRMRQHIRQLSMRVCCRISIGRRRLCRFVQNIFSNDRLATFPIKSSLLWSDIDECVQNALCKGGCTNTPGSYRCTCSPGFRSHGDDCTGKYVDAFIIDVIRRWLNVILVEWEGSIATGRFLVIRSTENNYGTATSSFSKQFEIQITIPPFVNSISLIFSLNLLPSRPCCELLGFVSTFYVIL